METDVKNNAKLHGNFTEQGETPAPEGFNNNETDERPRLSCSGSGRITRAFHLNHLRGISQGK